MLYFYYFVLNININIEQSSSWQLSKAINSEDALLDYFFQYYYSKKVKKGTRRTKVYYSLEGRFDQDSVNSITLKGFESSLSLWYISSESLHARTKYRCRVQLTLPLAATTAAPAVSTSRESHVRISVQMLPSKGRMKEGGFVRIPAHVCGSEYVQTGYYGFQKQATPRRFPLRERKCKQ